MRSLVDLAGDSVGGSLHVALSLGSLDLGYRRSKASERALSISKRVHKLIRPPTAFMDKTYLLPERAAACHQLSMPESRSGQ
jgi:hypothetical protein